MYNSPLNIWFQDYMDGLVSQVIEECDNQIVAYINEHCNIDVNKEELIKALNYDRDTYKRGLFDGRMEVLNALKDFIDGYKLG